MSITTACDEPSERRSVDYDKLWTHRGNKFVIGTLHGDSIEIIAQYNPKELARQAAATWNAASEYECEATRRTGESNMWSEYKTTAPRTLTFELAVRWLRRGHLGRADRRGISSA